MSALISKTYTFSSGTTIIAAEHNTNFDTAYNEINGNLDNANIKSGAGIVDSKLAAITTAGKVSGAALTSLSSVPSGAGLIPAINVQELSGANSTIKSISGLTTPLSLAQGGTGVTGSNAANGVCILDTSTGYVLTANLGSGTASSSTFLRGDSKWQAVTNLSNIVYSFALGGGSHATGVNGVIVGTSITDAGSSIKPTYWAVKNTSYSTILTTKYKAITGVTSVTNWCSIWNDGVNEACNCQVTIGTATPASVRGTQGQKSPEWKSFAIDVSSLTGTNDVTIQLKSEGSQVAYLDSIIGITS